MGSKYILFASNNTKSNNNDLEKSLASTPDPKEGLCDTFSTPIQRSGDHNHLEDVEKQEEEEILSSMKLNWQLLILI